MQTHTCYEPRRMTICLSNYVDMASGSDEYDAFNLDFTEEDFTYIDKTILGTESQAGESAGGPAITIEIEQSVEQTTAKDTSVNAPRPSPYMQFRAWNDALSVSDLVSPAWYVLSSLNATP